MTQEVSEIIVGFGVPVRTHGGDLPREHESVSIFDWNDAIYFVEQGWMEWQFVGMEVCDAFPFVAVVVPRTGNTRMATINNHCGKGG